MRAVHLLAIAAAAACGAQSTPAHVANRAPPPPKPACTDERIAAIAAHLHARWNSRDAPSVRCTPGRFPTPGFYVIADEQTGILADDGTTELVPFARTTTDADLLACATADLDGDGVDEIVETLEQETRTSRRQWLEIVRVTEHGLARLRGPHTSVDHRDLGSCSAQVRLAGQTIVLDVTHAIGLPPSDCLAAGTHTFALDREAVVEITRVSRR